MPRAIPGRWGLTADYLAAHVLLDWIGFIHEVSPINITPWNPPAGLVMAFSALCINPLFRFDRDITGVDHHPAFPESQVPQPGH